MRTSRKRTIAIIVPVTVLALAGIATAAGLTTTSTSLGGGSTLVTNNCAIAVSYATLSGTTGNTDVQYQAPTSTTLGGYYLKNVTLTPTGSDCGGASFRVTVATKLGAPLSEAFGSFGANGATLVAVKVVVNAYAFDVGAVYATVTNNTAGTPVTAP